MITLERIKDRDSRRQGVVYPGKILDGTKADIDLGSRIRIYGTEYAGTVAAEDFDVTFRLGDEAIYGSYNLIYTGRITNIGKASVSIEETPSRRVHRLTIFDFARRNRHYDAKAIEEHNQEASRSI